MNLINNDDDKLVCTSLKTIIESNNEFHVLATGYDGSEALSLYQQFVPDVLLMDIRMQKVNGLDGAREILEQFPEAKILFLTTFQDDEYIIKALHLGVKGYLLKQDFESIIPALTAVNSGQTVFGCEIVSKIPSLLNIPPQTVQENSRLTEKEFEILELVAQGLNNKEISSTLFLSEGTVRNYLSKILEKLNLRDRTQLAIYYYKNQLPD